MTKFFLSHASEDKEDFVKPLQAQLEAAGARVWLDELNIRAGDSLLRKIQEGISGCDYGIVVISPAFLAKKWQQAELDGLFALETETRKVILPVWKGVGLEEVKSASPILAGRRAALASDGVSKVAQELMFAVQAGDSVRSLGSAKERLKASAGRRKAKQREFEWLRSVEGARQARSAGHRILVNVYNALVKEHELGFIPHGNREAESGEGYWEFSVFGPGSSKHSVYLAEFLENHVADGVLKAEIQHIKNPHAFSSMTHPGWESAQEFRPGQSEGGGLIWIDREKNLLSDDGVTKSILHNVAAFLDWLDEVD